MSRMLKKSWKLHHWNWNETRSLNDLLIEVHNIKFSHLLVGVIMAASTQEKTHDCERELPCTQTNTHGCEKEKKKYNPIPSIRIQDFQSGE